MVSRKVLLPMAALAIVGAGAVGIESTQAASSGQNQSLVQDIASTFNLDPAKVQAVFNQHAQSQAAAKQTRYQGMLQKAVTDGKLTQAQLSAILSEHNTLLAQLQSARTQTGEARSAAIKAVYQDAKNWATQNNVSIRWLLGPRRLRDSGHMTAPNTSPSPSVSPMASS